MTVIGNSAHQGLNLVSSIHFSRPRAPAIVPAAPSVPAPSFASSAPSAAPAWWAIWSPERAPWGLAGHRLRQITLAAAAVALAPAWAQAQALPPDAGLLQLDKGPMKQPTRPQELPRPVDPRLAADASPSARTVAIDRVVVEGSSLVSQEEWDQRFFDVSEQALSLAQMRALAAQVQRVVQQAGRPFAVAYLPPQDLSTRELVIRVVEGRYGQSRVKAPWPVKAPAG
jgi:POTRA domain, ShlB-type